jgi:prepilin-type N-terminal cleavage/methylation domain-containing protein
MRKTMSGFTIVELIVVIVIIGILASVVIVSFANSRNRAQNVSRLEELRAWQKSFVQYKAANDGQYPAMADGGYCLGTGFPSGKCRDYTQAVNFYTEATSTTLMSALSTYDAPKLTPHVPVNGTVGPYVEYYSTVIHLTMAINGTASDCPSPTFYVWDDGAGRVLCRIALQR